MVGEWGQRQIGEFAHRKKLVNVDGVDLPPLSVTKGRGVVLQAERYNKRVATDPRKYVIVEDGDFAFDPMSLYYGAIGRVRGIGRGLISPDYVSFEVDSTVDPEFVARLLRAEFMVRQYEAVAESGNSYGKRRRVYWSVLSQIRVSLPALHEQRRIASVLRQVEDSVAAGEAVLEHLDLVRRALVQQLTRPGGEAEGGWVESSLGDILTETDERAGAREGLPLLSVTKRFGVILAKDRFSRVMAGKDLSRYRVAKRDSIVIDPMLLWDGVIALQRRFDQGLVSPDYRVFALSDRVDGQYFDALAHSDGLVRRYSAAAKGTNVRRRRISRDDFLAIKVRLPSLEEQRRRAGILASIDKRMEAERAALTERQGIHRALTEGLLSGSSHIRVGESIQ